MRRPQKWLLINPEKIISEAKVDAARCEAIHAQCERTKANGPGTFDKWRQEPSCHRTKDRMASGKRA
jgi:hypothetical protein